VTDYLTNQTDPVMLGSTGFGGSDESPRVSYTLRVNGLERPVDEAWIGESLLYVLRERLGLAGAKGGCDQGECGACSVQLDGQLTAACLVPAALAADSEIRTVEGLAADGSGTGSDVQRALAESGAVQCGYCVPGLAMAVHDLLERNHQPTELQAREALCGNLCRCTGYRGALAAVQAVARSRAEEAAASIEDPATGPEQPAPAGQADSADAAVADGDADGDAAVEGPVEPEARTEPVYIELPAQQQSERAPAGQAMDPAVDHAAESVLDQGQGGPMPPAEVDPLFGPMHELAGAAVEPQYAGYPQQGYPQGEGYQGGYQQQSDPHPGGDYATGQFPAADYGTGEYAYGEQGFAGQGFAEQPFTDRSFAEQPFTEQPFAEQGSTGYAPAGYPQGEYPADAFPLHGTQVPAQNGGPSPTAEAGVYVLPHQQQAAQQQAAHQQGHQQQSHQHHHSPAPEAGA
jgi:aerobic-type carbon monoxide dehydrogenase small subunit (CoxS/CutS family)